MKPQKTPNSQSNLEKEKQKLEGWYFLTSNHITKLQSSKHYGIGIKKSMEPHSKKKKKQSEPININKATQYVKTGMGKNETSHMGKMKLNPSHHTQKSA